jgi:hypothetical protein
MTPVFKQELAAEAFPDPLELDCFAEKVHSDSSGGLTSDYTHSSSL